MNEAAASTVYDEALGRPERLHPLYLLTGLGGSLRSAWGLVAGGALFASQERWWLVGLIGMAFAVNALGPLLIKWLKLEYRVGPNEIRIDSGFLSRTSRAIPFDRITDVDLEQGPLHRLFGLARVRFETGASAGSAEEDGVLDAIALDRAEALRAHVRNRRRNDVAEPVAIALDENPPIYAMTGRRVATAGLFNFSLAVIAGLFGITQTMGDVIGFDPFRREFWLDLLKRSEPLQNLIEAHQIVAVLGGSIILILVGIATGLIRTTLREYRFRLDRTEAGLRRRRGLLTLTDVTMPARRVQAAILTAGPIRARFGWWVLKLQSLATDGSKGDHVVAPLATEGEAAAILASLQSPIAPVAEPWKRVSRGFVTSFAALVVPTALITLAIPFLGGAGLSLISYMPLLGPILVLWTLVAPVALALRWMNWRHTHFAVDQDTLFVETGWWRRRRNIVPIRKIQSLDLNESFWGRAFGICSLRLGIAGGSGFSEHRVPALSRSNAETLRLRLLGS